MHPIVQSVGSCYERCLDINGLKRQIGLTLIFYVHWQPGDTVTTIIIYYISGETSYLCSRDKEKECLNVSLFLLLFFFFSFSFKYKFFTILNSI